MADAGVSMVLNRLAPLIEQRVREEVCLLLNASNEAQNLSEKLKKIHHVLADAERKGVTDPKVKSWLDKLQDIAYEIDDVLDEWELENIRQKLQDDANNSHDESSSDHDGIDSWEKKVCSFLQSVCLCFNQTIQRRSIAKKIQGLNGRLNSIAQETERDFNFLPNLGRHRSNQDFSRIITTSFVDLSEIQGRDHDKETLVNKLWSEGSSRDGVRTISIVGVGGMGKTTLAQLVFNDDTIQSQFQLKIWVCVSHPFNEIKIAKAILEVTNRNSLSPTQPQALLQSIETSISRKKFLLVMDDVWEDDDSKWKPLRACLKNGSPGSRILVTTRNENVAKAVGTTYMHRLEPLSDSYCWLVMSQIAFQERGEADREMLNEVGEEIAKKCKGLPLAAKTVGGLLRFKPRLQEWQDVLGSEMWELEKVRKDLFPLLTLSYNELHPTVKRCFSYCAVFPKDSRIEVDELIRIWMAQGFLLSSGNIGGKMEQMGRDYFDDLAMRSFFQDFEDDKSGNNVIISCKMHDIIHDFAQFLTKKECLIVERGTGGGEIVSVQNARHLNMLRAKGTSGTSPFSIEQAEKSRSCFCNTQVIPLNLFNHMKRVRSLSLRGCQMANIPKEIGNLIGLRYLDLSDNPLEHLPETIYDLYYLQTLDIHDCTTLSGLPDHGIHKLINLRHLVNSGSTSSDFKFPKGFQELTNLQTLNEFNASSATGNNLGNLKGLNQLGGSLCILLHSDPGELEAKKADLKSKKFIQQLTLEVRTARTQVVEALQPHPNLQTLVYEGRHLPKWIINLTNLRELILFYIRVEDADSLPHLGELSHLEKLALVSWRMKHGGNDFLRINTSSSSSSSSIFPRLKILQILSFEFWEEWEDISEEQQNNINMSIFPCLLVLQLLDCHQLKGLPLRLLHKAFSLQLLKIDHCKCLYNRYNQETGQDRTLLSDIPCVKTIHPHYE